MDDPTDTHDIERPENVTVRVTRGEDDLAVGGAYDQPDRAEVTIEPTEDGQVRIQLDAASGDHGSAYADVELTLEEARIFQERLAETTRWIEDRR